MARVRVRCLVVVTGGHKGVGVRSFVVTGGHKGVGVRGFLRARVR